MCAARVLRMIYSTGDDERGVEGSAWSPQAKRERNTAARHRTRKPVAE